MRTKETKDVKKKVRVFEDRRLKAVINRLAKRIELTKNFKDIKAVNLSHPPFSDLVAWTDMETEVLYLNIGQKVMSETDMIRHVEGLVIHEHGHLDKRVKSPSSAKMMLEHIKRVEKNKKDVDSSLLNVIYDLEIHYQYNVRGLVRPSQKQALREMLTELRNQVIEENRDDLIISLEHQFNEYQEKVKEVIEDRSLSIVEKYKKLKKVVQDYEKEFGGKYGKCVGKIILSDKDKDEIKKNGRSIKEKVEKQKKANDMKEKLTALGFSDEEINAVADKKDNEELIEDIENLEKSMNDITFVLDKTQVREKIREMLKSEGSRLNGYHRIRDYDELTEEVEELIINKHDIEGIEVPTLVKPDTRGIIVLIRDTSGSVSSPPLNKIVRDITVTLIKLAKKKHCKIAVMDFHSQPELYIDRKGSWVSTDYNYIMLDAMRYREGYATCLTLAIKKLNEELKKNNLNKENLNVFVVSDSYVEYNPQVRIENPNCNLVSFSCGDYIDDAYKKFSKTHKGKMFQIEEVKDKLISVLVENV